MAGQGSRLKGSPVLFRLEKVYNLVKETMPKKPDAQSGERALPWAPGWLVPCLPPRPQLTPAQQHLGD